MEKNIRVVDEWGNEYEATYPKRAKGLVKNGRARFLDENTICLACPPHEFETEDIKMSENIEKIEKVEETKIAVTNYTIDYILVKIAEIQSQTEYLNQSISELSKVRSAGPEDIGAAEKAKALSDVVRCRETTNQQILKLYEKMYDNMSAQDRGVKAEIELDKWNAISKLADVANNDDDFASERAETLDSIRQILRENK